MRKNGAFISAHRGSKWKKNLLLFFDCKCTEHDYEHVYTSIDTLFMASFRQSTRFLCKECFSLYPFEVDEQWAEKWKQCKQNFQTEKEYPLEFRLMFFLCLVLGCVLLCCSVLFFNDMHLASATTFVVCMGSTHLARLELFVIVGAFFSFCHCCIPSSKFMFLTWSYGQTCYSCDGITGFYLK